MREGAPRPLSSVCVCVQPAWPFGKARYGRPPPPFFPVDARPGIIVAILMGLQHALAMVGGIITPPLLVYRVTVPDVRPPPFYSVVVVPYRAATVIRPPHPPYTPPLLIRCPPPPPASPQRIPPALTIDALARTSFSTCL